MDVDGTWDAGTTAAVKRWQHDRDARRPPIFPHAAKRRVTVAGMTQSDPYDILGVRSDATDAEIKTAYRQLAALYHPDRNPGFQDAATERLKQVNDAYSRVRDARSAASGDGASRTAASSGAGPAGHASGGSRSTAQQRCSELNERDGALPGVRWMAKQTAPGQWKAVRVRVPGAKATGPLTTIKETPRGPDPSDPRPIVHPTWGF